MSAFQDQRAFPSAPFESTRTRLKPGVHDPQLANATYGDLRRHWGWISQERRDKVLWTTDTVAPAGFSVASESENYAFAQGFNAARSLQYNPPFLPTLASSLRTGNGNVQKVSAPQRFNYQPLYEARMGMVPMAGGTGSSRAAYWPSTTFEQREPSDEPYRYPAPYMSASAQPQTITQSAYFAEGPAGANSVQQAPPNFHSIPNIGGFTQSRTPALPGEYSIRKDVLDNSIDTLSDSDSLEEDEREIKSHGLSSPGISNLYDVVPTISSSNASNGGRVEKYQEMHVPTESVSKEWLGKMDYGLISRLLRFARQARVKESVNSFGSDATSTPHDAELELERLQYLLKLPSVPTSEKVAAAIASTSWDTLHACETQLKSLIDRYPYDPKGKRKSKRNPENQPNWRRQLTLLNAAVVMSEDMKSACLSRVFDASNRNADIERATTMAMERQRKRRRSQENKRRRSEAEKEGRPSETGDQKGGKRKKAKGGKGSKEKGS